jgi:phosphoribosylformylglycinamidine cyclo-ligase
MVVIVEASTADDVFSSLEAAGETVMRLGSIVPRETGSVVFNGRLAL